METEKVSVAFARIAALAAAMGIENIDRLKGCWEYQVSEQWFIAVNGHPAPQEIVRPPNNLIFTVEAFHCYVEFNGWPAGQFHPFGGWIAAGQAANEDAFIYALDLAIEAAKQGKHGKSN